MQTRQKKWRLAGVLLFTLFLFLAPRGIALSAPLRITVQAPPSLLSQPAARLAIEDAVNLMQQSFPKALITMSDRNAAVRLILPDIFVGIAASERASSSRWTEEAGFSWDSARWNGITNLTLTATTPQGVANGIYALLQEKLGIRFIHPRQTIVPTHRRWPLPGNFRFSGHPNFPARGFHLHTLHPLELTEQLHDPAIPMALDDVIAYLDWLARNGQNTFQFFLLRGVDQEKWPSHARKIVDYAHKRGIRCGIEVSLAMLQQQAFQVITLLRPYPSYYRQIDRSLAWLFQAPWDFITLEATMGEHLPFLGQLLPKIQTYFEQQVTDKYKAKLLYATHVICEENGNKVRRPNRQQSGILIHTVMCYSATEPKAPVYGNVNQQFMLEAAKEENRRRETWYWPESSYWVGFDTSVPLLLLPYLDVRWSDMAVMAQLGVPGHLTFSSGWEWGYWLIDWSLARWSWRFSENGKEVKTFPTSRLADLFPDPSLLRLWQDALALQNHFLKERELLRFMAALTPFSELSPPLDRPFQPVPGFRYDWLLSEASPSQAAAATAQPLADLDTYAGSMERLTGQLAARLNYLAIEDANAISIKVAVELVTGLRVTALRARHRAATIRAILAMRSEAQFIPLRKRESERHLDQAKAFRIEALRLVRRQEDVYRYPRELVAARRPSFTAYPFGYLYPVSTLFFWEREEEQVRKKRFDPFFMNLWDFRRTIGLESLIFRK